MKDMMLVYITCKNNQEAKTIGHALLAKRLCACINILDGMNSVYFWPPKSGTLEEASESILLVKTLEEKFKQIEEEVTKLHSSDTPCVMSIPVSNVSEKYYEWIQGEINQQVK